MCAVYNSNWLRAHLCNGAGAIFGMLALLSSAQTLIIASERLYFRQETSRPRPRLLALSSYQNNSASDEGQPAFMRLAAIESY
ncbi:hypothetical protein N7468_004105 [Penicillium chermesinum]|uniref:Uncharacterized protein n=1 Tax=Penicillium chermesinum TaxID=63820 RepID=A0A9W9P8I0_9EURO|nr:uncharacterized protein N7468_004105 [Penicillium chermesinum]KAJ5239486.1 hypothetical protein N7468_004105 [Penicillium chermesinum]